MADINVSAWLPVGYADDAITTVKAVSAVEALATRIPMSTQTVLTPRSADVSVSVIPSGAAYPEDGSANDTVLLVAKKFGTALRIAEEDANDAASFVNAVNVKQAGWANSYAKELDNACLGTTAVANGTTVPFNSVYYSVTQADANSGYTANANLVQTAVATAATYAQISSVLGKAEGGNYFDDSKTVVIAHPNFKQALRGLVDIQGRPLFVDAAVNGTPDRVLGYPVHWSIGARTSATASSNPTGNFLLIVGNSDFLLLGVRSGPEVENSDQPGFLTDDLIIKMRARRGFAVGSAAAFAVLEQR